MSTILITGGSGRIGSHLTVALKADGHDVRWLSRTPGMRHGVRAFEWDPDRAHLDEAALEYVDHIIHLAGAGIADARWNKTRVQELITSRTRGPALLHDACTRRNPWPKSFISSAGIGYYGAVTNDHVYTEVDPPGTDTIARISVAWERAADTWSEHTRVVKLRTPIVLARDAGALLTLARIARFGLASPLGTGEQIMPWIHIADLVNAYRLAITNDGMHGAYNIVAPEQPDNREFMRALAHALHRPFFLPSVPGSVMRIAVGGIAEVLLNGSAVSGARARALGFTAEHDRLEGAFAHLFG